MTSSAAPATPRLAASVLLLQDDPLRVLMMERHAQSTFGSALVFPGGTIDAEDYDDAWLPFLGAAADLPPDERALRIAACREVYEETGLLLLADETVTVPADLAGRVDFREALRVVGVPLGCGALQAFGHWITPEGRPKRFDTHFFLARAPRGQTARCDGVEGVSLEWMQPAEILAFADSKERQVLPPTEANVARLSASPTLDHAFEIAPTYPVVTVLPWSELSEQGVCVRIQVEAGYAKSEFWVKRN